VTLGDMILPNLKAWLRVVDVEQYLHGGSGV